MTYLQHREGIHLPFQHQVEEGNGSSGCVDRAEGTDAPVARSSRVARSSQVARSSPVARSWGACWDRHVGTFLDPSGVGVVVVACVGCGIGYCGEKLKKMSKYYYN